MAYTVDPDNASSPLDTDSPASNVALELRLLKAKINALEATVNGLQTVPIGAILATALPAAPTKYLAVPNVPTNVSRTTYNLLFAAIGSTFGAGDGSTTFGLPYIPDGHTMIQSTLGAVSAGTLVAHKHFYEDGFNCVKAPDQTADFENLSIVPIDIAPNPWEFGGYMHRRRLESESTGAAGGNLPAGIGMKFYIRYQ